MRPVVLTIAGSDPSGGAGIQADLKTFNVFGIFGMAAPTALTAQNTLGVHNVFNVPPDFVAEQIHCVLSDIGAAAVKTGMLASGATVESIVQALEDSPNRGPLVVDPVLISSSGRELLDLAGREALLKHLIPLADLITPNADEAAVLTGRQVQTEADAEAAAEALIDLGAGAALIKGGHRPSDSCDDFLLDAKGNRLWIRGDRIDSPHTHGTGCVFSAAITASLAHGESLEQSCRHAKVFITGAIFNALEIGAGTGSVDCLWHETL